MRMERASFFRPLMQVLCFVGFAGGLGFTAARIQTLPTAPTPLTRPTVHHLPTPAVPEAPILTKAALERSGFDTRGDVYVTARREVADTLSGARQARLHRAADGHYYADISVNGTPVRMIVDTGATKVALSRTDARKAGLLLTDRDYSASGLAVAGTVKMAPIVIARMQVGEVELRDVPAVVFDADEGPSLLGMSFLNRMREIEIRDKDLVLTR